MFCGNYILSNRSKWAFYFSEVFNLILQSVEKNNYKDIDGLKKTIKGLMKQINSNEDVKDYINGNMLKKFESRGN